MNTTDVVYSEKSAPNVWISGLIGGALALVLALALLVVAGLLGISLQVSFGPPGSSPLIPLTAAQIIPTVLVPTLVATVFYAVLQRFFPQRASRIFQIIAVVILLLSFGGPLSLAIPTVSKIFMALMHIATAVAIVWALTLRK